MPAYPTNKGDGGGTSGGVQSVSGPSVSNIDPENPVVLSPSLAPLDTTYVLKGNSWMPAFESNGGIRLRWSTDTVNPPIAGSISADSNDLALVTELRVSTTLRNTADLKFILEKLKVNNTIYGTVDQNNVAFGGYTLTGNSINNGTYFSLPVVAETAGTNPADGDYLLIGVIATDVESGRYLGVFASVAALNAAYPTANEGDSATVDVVNGETVKNIFYWQTGLWVDSGAGSIGDMLKAVADPTNKNADAYSMINMSETATAKVMTDAERALLSGLELRINNTNGYGFYIDSATELLPQNFNDGVWQTLTNDKLFSDENLPSGALTFFNSVTNLFQPDQSKGIYGFNVLFLADAVSRDKVVQFVVLIPDGNGVGVDREIYRRTIRLAKSDGAENYISVYFETAASPIMISNGVRIDLMFDGTSAGVHDVSLQLIKANAPLL